MGRTPGLARAPCQGEDPRGPAGRTRLNGESCLTRLVKLVTLAPFSTFPPHFHPPPPTQRRRTVPTAAVSRALISNTLPLEGKKARLATSVCDGAFFFLVAVAGAVTSHAPCVSVGAVCAGRALGGMSFSSFCRWRTSEMLSSQLAQGPRGILQEQ